MGLRFVERISDLPADGWNSLFPQDFPFARHEFLAALERHCCVGARSGWTPRHAVLEDQNGQLLAAAPMYLKTHSYGEFVFDFAWASASQRIGASYYPKALVAIPFTPSCGPRFAARNAAARRTVFSPTPDASARRSDVRCGSL